MKGFLIWAVRAIFGINVAKEVARAPLFDEMWTVRMASASKLNLRVQQANAYTTFGQPGMLCQAAELTPGATPAYLTRIDQMRKGKLH